MDVIDQGGEPVRRALWLYQLRRSSRVLAALLMAPARTVGFVFTRDNSCWVYGGVSMDPMAKPARQRESLHIRAVYRYHPCSPTLISSPTTAMMTPNHLPASVEGGDVHVLGRSAVLMGMGERTTPMAAEILCRALFDSGQAHTVIAIELPKSHAMMHLDTVMTMIDRTTFVLYPASTATRDRGPSPPATTGQT